MKTRTLVVFAMAAIIVSSCAINKKAYRASSKVAIISINSIEKIKNNSSLQSRLLTEVRDLDTVLDNTANMVQAHFYRSNMGLLKKVVEEDQILQNASFQDYSIDSDNHMKGLDQLQNIGVKYIAVEGYPVLKTSQKSVIMQSFDHLPSDIDAVMVLSNHFNFVESMNFGVGGISSAGLHGQRVQSLLTVYILNRDGKKILHRSFTGTSDGKLEEKEEGGPSLNELANQALSESYREFKEFMVKKVGS